MKRKFFIFLLSFTLTVFMMPIGMPVAFAADTWDGSSADTAWYDDHMGDTTYTISTGAQLAGLSFLVNTGDTATGGTPVDFNGKTINLDGDIELAGNQWTPIGCSDTYPFSGTFDGGRHTVSGLHALYNLRGGLAGFYSQKAAGRSGLAVKKEI